MKSYKFRTNQIVEYKMNGCWKITGRYKTRFGIDRYNLKNIITGEILNSCREWELVVKKNN